jgi:UDP-N-acetylmuramoylalanine-D-glutamate ligase
MTDSNRRSFLKHTVAASAGAAAWAWNGGIHAAGANERPTVGIIGCGGRGAGLAEEFAGLTDVAYVCDPDESRRRQTPEKVRAQHAVADLRHILDDKSVDAVVIATPDHWHAPTAILACDAGKHVYQELSTWFLEFGWR